MCVCVCVCGVQCNLSRPNVLVQTDVPASLHTPLENTFDCATRVPEGSILEWRYPHSVYGTQNKIYDTVYYIIIFQIFNWFFFQSF